MSVRTATLKPVIRSARFGLVGLSGLLLNSLLLAICAEGLGIHYLLAAGTASIGSTIWTFGLTDNLVFGDRGLIRGWTRRLFAFWGLNTLALLVVRWPLIWLLTSGLHVHYLISNAVSIAAVFCLRYLVSNHVIWARLAVQPGEPASRERASPSRPAINPEQATCCYSIHDIVAVESEIALPELEAFRVNTLHGPPAIRVRLGGSRPRSSSPACGVRQIDYDEGLGPLGFWTRIEIGACVDIRASELVRWSPHVLYTNIVEPVLRWTFVERGYGLLHGACLAIGDDAYLITARTDTGKTTTLLQLLQRNNGLGLRFLSDDLTLVSASGCVLAYPKPLTISAHTLQAINVNALPRRRGVPLGLQSRLHSRGGRQAAHWLARTPLPMATLNAIVQALVPPPKYYLHEVLPGVAQARGARLAHVFVLEPEGDGIHRLTEAESVRILLENTADAYGFPPYPSIAAGLYTAQRDLQLVERTITAQALRQVPTTLIRSRDRLWWQRILALIREAPRAAETELSTSTGSSI